MECQEARAQVIDAQRGRLRSDEENDLRAHLETCAECSRLDRAERVVTEILECRLPQHAASLSLKRRVTARWPVPPIRTASWWSRWGRSLAPAFAMAVVLLIALPVYYVGIGDRGNGRVGMVQEAVNDYLRVLSSQYPLEIESGGLHQVKPWFEGRLDFAPTVSFEGNEDFPLKGGSVGYFLDRKAAVFVYARRLHKITLFVFRAEGLPWPTRGLEPMGNVRVSATVSRGFNVLLWRSGELGYALVSDLDVKELLQLGTKLAESA
jgi:anti-sigma factor RsiW